MAEQQQQQQFYLLLGNLMSPDNNVRKQSEVREPQYTGLISQVRSVGEIVLAAAKLPKLAARARQLSRHRFYSPRAM